MRVIRLPGHADVDPLLELLDLGLGLHAVAWHLSLAEGADDGVGILDDMPVTENECSQVA
jgi:hypothetical protein